MAEQDYTLTNDEKSIASFEMGSVIRQTAGNFPDERFRPHLISDTGHYTIAGIDPSPYSIWVTADGVGTKPQLAEGLYAGNGDPGVFETLAFDTLAMIDGDEARFGRFMVGAVEILDLNSAKNVDAVRSLARALKNACDSGHFALLNGETAELGYRTSGYGETRLNWNAVGISLVVPRKLILGEKLAPGQPVVALREQSIRSNGITKAREILETAYLLSRGFQSKEELLGAWFRDHGFKGNSSELLGELTRLSGHDFPEQVLLPWPQAYPEIAKQILMPSRLYGPVIYEAQGGVDGPRVVDMVAAAHITGGGIPEKAKRMIEASGFGIHIDPVFPDPESVQSLLSLADTFPPEIREKLEIDDASACRQWNRGIGFLVVAKDMSEARKLVDVADRSGYEAAVAGEIVEEPKITFRGHTWTYEKAEGKSVN